MFLADVLGWQGLFIEPDEASYSELAAKYAAGRVQTVNAAVTPQNVESLFAAAGVPAEPDVLSIDVDGQDYWIWEALEAHRPRVVVIEYNAVLPARAAARPATRQRPALGGNRLLRRVARRAVRARRAKGIPARPHRSRRDQRVLRPQRSRRRRPTATRTRCRAATIRTTSCRATVIPGTPTGTATLTWAPASWRTRAAAHPSPPLRAGACHRTARSTAGPATATTPAPTAQDHGPPRRRQAQRKIASSFTPPTPSRLSGM